MNLDSIYFCVYNHENDPFKGGGIIPVSKEEEPPLRSIPRIVISVLLLALVFLYPEKAKSEAEVEPLLDRTFNLHTLEFEREKVEITKVEIVPDPPTTPVVKKKIAYASIPANREDNRSLARKYVVEKWGENEWPAFDQLMMKESGYNHLAQNPRSSAFGMFQFLNSTWSSYGCSKTSDPVGQIQCGIRYIEGRYGSPSKALAFHKSHNWY